MRHIKQRSPLVTAMLGIFIASPVTAQTTSPERIDEVAERGAHVMPFDLKKTQHIFNKTNTGGVQQVFVRDSSNSQQIAMIRQHLTKITQDFSRGDFSAPAKIHGADMPGLAELRNAKPGQLRVEYKDIKDGGEIIYSSTDQGLIAGIHKWFDAQLADHGPDAMQGNQHGGMHDMNGTQQK
jgi:hypothetical protein